MQLFTMLPISVSDPSLPVVPAADIDRLVEYEQAAYAHWIFDRGAESLVDLKSEKPLTPQSTTHSFTANSVVVKSAFGEALESDFDDRATMTWAAVWKRAANQSSTTVVLGSNAGNIAGERIQLPSTPSDGLEFRVAGFPTVKPDYLAGDDIGDFVFIAGYSDETSRGFLFGGDTAWRESSGGLKAVSAATLALGNIYQGGLADIGLEFAEFIVFDAALSGSEILEVYFRSQARMSERGITI